MERCPCLTGLTAYRRRHRTNARLGCLGLRTSVMSFAARLLTCFGKASMSSDSSNRGSTIGFSTFFTGKPLPSSPTA